MTNIIRHKYNLPILKWDDETSEVAFMHSEDMKENHYFSHESKNTVR